MIQNILSKKLHAQYFIILMIICFLCVSCKSNGNKNTYQPPPPTKKNLEYLKQLSKNNLIFIKGGSFLMGDLGVTINGKKKPWTLDKDNKPAHKVILDDYFISKYEVTYYEFDLFTQTNGKPLSQIALPNPVVRKARNPAAADWNDANDYCKWLADLTGLPYALPTEAQWEYAARSRGKNVLYATDNGKLDIGRNYQESPQRIMPVGSFPPNPIGLFDMSGNGDEWVLDWFDKDYYKKSPSNNPKGPSTGTHKVLRGGGILNSSSCNTVFLRHKLPIDFVEKQREPYKYPSENMCFRCVLNISK